MDGPRGTARQLPADEGVLPRWDNACMTPARAPHRPQGLPWQRWGAAFAIAVGLSTAGGPLQAATSSVVTTERVRAELVAGRLVPADEGGGAGEAGLLRMTLDIRAYRERPAGREAPKRSAQALWAFLAGPAAAAPDPAAA